MKEAMASLKIKEDFDTKIEEMKDDFHANFQKFDNKLQELANQQEELSNLCQKILSRMTAGNEIPNERTSSEKEDAKKLSASENKKSKGEPIDQNGVSLENNAL